MPRFEPNELQKALFAEVIDSVLSESGAYMASYHPLAVQAWLRQAKPTLVALAGMGRAAVRNGTSDSNTMLLDFMRAMDSHPHEVLRWLGDFACLSNLVSPSALRGLSEEDCRNRFKALASLDAGL